MLVLWTGYRAGVQACRSLAHAGHRVVGPTRRAPREAPRGGAPAAALPAAGRGPRGVPRSPGGDLSRRVHRRGAAGRRGHRAPAGRAPARPGQRGRRRPRRGAVPGALRQARAGPHRPGGGRRAPRDDHGRPRRARRAVAGAPLHDQAGGVALRHVGGGHQPRGDAGGARRGRGPPPPPASRPSSRSASRGAGGSATACGTRPASTWSAPGSRATIRGAPVSRACSAPHPPDGLESAIERLFGDVDYRGPATISFLERDGRLYVHDVNLRLGASVGLMVGSGFDLPRRAVEAALGVDSPARPACCQSATSGSRVSWRPSEMRCEAATWASRRRGSPGGSPPRWRFRAV